MLFTTALLKSNWFTLSKPKQVAKGGHGIRQYFKIDETKLTAEKRLGKNLDANEYSLLMIRTKLYLKT